MSEQLKNVVIVALVASLALVWYSGRESSEFGAAGVTTFTGSSTGGEASVTTTGTEIVSRSAGRTYLIICKTNSSNTDLRQVTLAVNASPSHGRGVILDGRVPCWESNDLNLVTGEINGVASPSAASVSYMQW